VSQPKLLYVAPYQLTSDSRKENNLRNVAPLLLLLLTMMVLLLMYNCRDWKRLAEIVRSWYSESANDRVACSTLPDVNLQAWAERPPPP